MIVKDHKWMVYKPYWFSQVFTINYYEFVHGLCSQQSPKHWGYRHIAPFALLSKATDGIRLIDLNSSGTTIRFNIFNDSEESIMIYYDIL